jgi:single-stranded-DNA-specific exonuclease
MKTYSVKSSTADMSLLDRLLYYRGVRTPEEIEAFLHPNYERHTHDPFLLKDMDKAVERILKAIREDGKGDKDGKGKKSKKKSEKIVIYSDYDTDGIPAGVALHDFFKKIGYTNFSNYIPHRHDEGFGLNSDAVRQFAADGVTLLITIDCGIADVGPVAEAQAAGIDVIITDHHMPPRKATAKKDVEEENLPPAFAIINPKQTGCTYPEKMLCGAGVVYKLIQALIIKGNKEKSFTGLSGNTDGVLKDGWEKWLLDMVGIATLSDMVPLTGENRVFAYYGLVVLRKSPRLGLNRLLAELGVDQRYLTEDDVGFTIGPRINAASRMGVPMDAFHLLSTDDPVVAGQYAKHLNEINDERKGTVAALVKEIKKTIKERWGSESDDAEDSGVGKKSSPPKMPAVIVLGNPDWRPSLVGLAANTVAEEYHRPVYLWGRDGDNVIKGSCRSDGETDLVALMRLADGDETTTGAPKTFIQFGGHAMSGGFAVANDKIHTLSDKLNAAFEKLQNKNDEEKEGKEGKDDGKGEKMLEAIALDGEMSLADVTWDTYRTIEKLAPFGTGNPKPLFMFKNVTPTSVRQFGKTKNHLELMFPGSIKAIAFFKTADDWKDILGHELSAGRHFTLIAVFEKSIFRGKTELRLRIVDIVKN